MSKYQYTDKMDEISGFGGGYEKACRNMVIAGLEYLDKQSKADPKFHSYEHVYGIIIEDNEDAKELTKVMLKAANNDCTGAMMQACVSHVLVVRKNGWSKYAKEMSKVKSND